MRLAALSLTGLMLYGCTVPQSLGNPAASAVSDASVTPSPLPTASPSPVIGPTPAPLSSPASSVAASPVPAATPAAFGPKVEHLGGNGVAGDFTSQSGNSSSADKLSFQLANAVVAMDNGEIIFSEIGRNRIGRISQPFVQPGEKSTRVATVLLDKGISNPVAMVRFGKDLLVSDSFAHKVWRLTLDGDLQEFAGIGTAGFAGDKGQAKQAQLYTPQGLALGPDESVYVADSNNQVIRKIDRLGIVSTVGGTPGVAAEKGAFQDGGKLLRYPLMVAVSPKGELYMVDERNQIRRQRADGTWAVIAGTGTPEADRSETELNRWVGVGTVTSIAFGPDGLLYYTDSFNQKIRRLATDIRGETVAGTGKKGQFPHYDAPPLDTTVDTPTTMTFDARGNIYYFAAGTYRWLTLPIMSAP